MYFIFARQFEIVSAGTIIDLAENHLLTSKTKYFLIWAYSYPESPLSVGRSRKIGQLDHQIIGSNTRLAMH